MMRTLSRWRSKSRKKRKQPRFKVTTSRNHIGLNLQYEHKNVAYSQAQKGEEHKGVFNGVLVATLDAVEGVGIYRGRKGEG